MMDPYSHYPYGLTQEVIESIKRRVHDIEQQFPAVRTEISQAKAAIWGTTAEDAPDG
jgi:hypothetical protein